MGDVARLAGVSQQTVSRVVNASDYVGGETRERVRAAMRELNYRPNPAAQALVTGRSKTLGVISLESAAYGPASLQLGVERAAHAHGYYVTVARLAGFDLGCLLAALDQLQRQGVDGILVNAGHEEVTRELTHLPLDVPLIAIEDLPGAGSPTVYVDQHAGADAAVRLLLDLGHDTVAHLAGPHEWASAGRRLEGWREALGDRDAPEVLHGDWTAGSGFELGRRLARDPSVTAVFVANDEMALGVMRAMLEAGRSVPGDVSIVGFDDVPYARYLTPPLTTVRQDLDETGRRAVAQLLHAIEGVEDIIVRAALAPELIVRESTAPPPS